VTVTLVTTYLEKPSPRQLYVVRLLQELWCHRRPIELRHCEAHLVGIITKPFMHLIAKHMGTTASRQPIGYLLSSGMIEYLLFDSVRFLCHLIKAEAN
jgi:hypothetical protein